MYATRIIVHGLPQTPHQTLHFVLANCEQQTLFLVQAQQVQQGAWRGFGKQDAHCSVSGPCSRLEKQTGFCAQHGVALWDLHLLNSHCDWKVTNRLVLFLICQCAYNMTL